MDEDVEDALLCFGFSLAAGVGVGVGVGVGAVGFAVADGGFGFGGGVALPNDGRLPPVGMLLPSRLEASRTEPGRTPEMVEATFSALLLAPPPPLLRRSRLLFLLPSFAGCSVELLLALVLPTGLSGGGEGDDCFSLRAATAGLFGGRRGFLFCFAGVDVYKKCKYAVYMLIVMRNNSYSPRQPHFWRASRTTRWRWSA